MKAGFGLVSIFFLSDQCSSNHQSNLSSQTYQSATLTFTGVDSFHVVIQPHLRWALYCVWLYSISRAYGFMCFIFSEPCLDKNSNTKNSHWAICLWGSPSWILAGSQIMSMERWQQRESCGSILWQATLFVRVFMQGM